MFHKKNADAWENKKAVDTKNNAMTIETANSLAWTLDAPTPPHPPPPPNLACGGSPQSIFIGEREPYAVFIWLL